MRQYVLVELWIPTKAGVLAPTMKITPLEREYAETNEVYSAADCWYVAFAEQEGAPE